MDYLVVFTTKNANYESTGDTTDYWEAFLDDEEEAKKRYCEVLKLENLWSASLCLPKYSTDYEEIKFSE